MRAVAYRLVSFRAVVEPQSTDRGGRGAGNHAAGLAIVHSLKEDAAARHWLLTIARREHARLYERKRHETVNIDELVDAEASSLASKTESATAEEDLRDVRQAIFELSQEYREPLVLQVLMGYSTEEIAQQMNLTQGAVLTRLFRARNQLRARLGLGPDESQDTV